MPLTNDDVITEFRTSGGKVGGPFTGAPLLLLTTTGARSGAARTTPLAYASPDRPGEDPAGAAEPPALVRVFGTAAGAPRDPQWYRNLRAAPQAGVEIGYTGGVFSAPAEARFLAGAERDRAWEAQTAHVPAFAGYAEQAAPRTIPVVDLTLRTPSRASALGDNLLAVHTQLRRGLADLLDGVRDYAAGGAAPGVGARSTAEQLRAACAEFCGFLEGHHDAEEQRGFPALEQADPRLAPVVDTLRREHVRVTALKREVLAHAERLTARGPDARRGADAVRADLERLVAELEQHFAREERHLLAALDRL
ncbi:nitroreductase/quinone reductase family protein [Nocardiopsis coralliicola]